MILLRLSGVLIGIAVLCGGCTSTPFSFRAFSKTEPGGVIAAGTYYGSAVLKDITTQRLSVYGSLELEKSTVNQINVRGNAHIVKSMISEALDMYGNAELRKVTVEGRVIIYGTLQAKDCTFTEEIAVNGRICAKSSHFADITVEKKSSATALHNYDIELRDGSTVENIEFFGQEGTIFCDSSSTIRGEMVNARVIRE